MSTRARWAVGAVALTLLSAFAAETDWFARVLATVREDDPKQLPGDGEAAALVLAELGRAAAALSAAADHAALPPANGQKTEALARCLRALGELRCRAAVPVVVKHLQFGGGGQLRPAFLSTASLRPVMALVQIGTPSLRPLLERVVSEQDEVTPALAAAVVHGVLGRKLGVVYLQDAVAAEPDAARRERLRMVTRSLQEYVDLPPPDLRWGPEPHK